MKVREVREFLSGALAGAMTKAVLAPLETIRFGFVFFFSAFSIKFLNFISNLIMFINHITLLARLNILANMYLLICS